MNRTNQGKLLADQGSYRPLRLGVLGHFLTPIIVTVAISVALLVGTYLLPLATLQDIGTSTTSFTGLYKPERNEHFAFAYTDGEASLQIPKVGAGRYAVRMRIGGPGEHVPVRTAVQHQSAHVSLGKVAPIRIYHLLVPVGDEGNLALHLNSTTVSLPNDARRPGVLLDWLEVRSLGWIQPPLGLLLSVPLVTVFLWLALIQLGGQYRWKILNLLLGTGLLYLGYALSRGKLEMQPWWAVGLAILIATTVSLSRFNGQWLARPIVGVSAIFFIWHLALRLVAGGGLWYSEQVYTIGRHITGGGEIVEQKQWLWQTIVTAWSHWDSGFYHTIARDGYAFQGQQWPSIAFFPLYPILIRLCLPLAGNNPFLASLLVSHLALFAALLLLYDLLAGDFGGAVAYRSLFLLLLFPTSVFLAAGYTESLALALTIAAIWAIRHQRWWLAGLAGALLSLTRLPGIMITPIMVFAYLQQHNWRWRAIRPSFLAVLLPPAGLGLFMIYQWWHFGTPVAFLIAQRSWDQRLSPPWVMPRLWLAWFANATDQPMMIFQALCWVLFIGLTVVALLRLPRLYGLTTVLLLLPAYLSNRAHSLPRYVLLGFPAFVVMAIFAEQLWARRLIISLMTPLLVLAILLFVNGFWVA